MCGWVADKWGVSWQVVSRKYLGWVEKGAKEGAEEKDKEGVARTMEKMMGMKKLDEGELREAFEGK